MNLYVWSSPDFELSAAVMYMLHDPSQHAYAQVCSYIHMFLLLHSYIYVIMYISYVEIYGKI